MRTRLHLIVALLVLFVPAAGQAGPKAARTTRQPSGAVIAPAKKASPAPKTVRNPNAEARRKTQKVVDAKKKIFDGRPCICKDDRFRSAVGEITLRVSPSSDGRIFASAVCWLPIANTKTGKTEYEACVDNQTLELDPG